MDGNPRYRLTLLALAAVVVLLALAAPAAAAPFTWTPATVDGVVPINGISCPSPSLCVAVDNNGNVVTSADPAGGAGTWTVSNITTAFIEAVSCPSVSLCVAVDGAGDVHWSTDPNGGAGTWSSATVNPGQELRAISCPTVTLCVAGADSGNVMWSTNPTGGVLAWTFADIEGPSFFTEFSISCPATTLCVAANDNGEVWTTPTPTGLAGAWTKATANPGGTVGLAMSCPSPTFCALSNDSGEYNTTVNPTGGAAAWTVSSLGFFTILYGVSCPTASLCVSVDNGGNARTSTNPTGGAGTWAPEALGVGGLFAISCPSANFCVAASSSGDVVVGTRGTLSVNVAGTGTGSVSGSGLACPGVCSQTYPGGTLATVTATPGSDGSTFTGWSGACTGTGPCSTTMSSDRAVTATFTAAPADTGPPVVAAQDPIPAPPPSALPPPVVAKTANARPVSGKVLVKEAGTTRFVALSEPEQVKFGAIFDTRKGSVEIVVANGRGGFDRATFSEGMFKLSQTTGRQPIAELTLVGGNFKGCPKPARGGAARSAASRGRSVRHLWGNGSGKFRTKGRYASATIRGTRWLTDDRCLGTLARVTAGAVTVRDLVKRKSVALKAPKSYFARAR